MCSGVFIITASCRLWCAVADGMQPTCWHCLPRYPHLVLHSVSQTISVLYSLVCREALVLSSGETLVLPSGETLVLPSGETLVLPSGETLVLPSGETLVLPSGNVSGLSHRAAVILTSQM